MSEQSQGQVIDDDPVPAVPTAPDGFTEQRSSHTEKPQTPESAGRPKSTASSDIVFEARKKKRKGTPSLNADDGGHDVTFTVTIAMAVPTEKEDQSPDLRQMLKKRVIEAPRAQNYYHLEYQLLPGDDELMKTDVVTYGVACKLYMERHDARVVKTWQDGEVTWFAWSHSHTVNVTKEVLLQLFNHNIELRVWDTKDKCSSRARFDRPKAFGLPQPKPGEKPEDIGGVKAMVTKQMNNFLQQQPKKGVPVRALPSKLSLTNIYGHRRQSTAGPDGHRSRAGIISPNAPSKTLVAVPNKEPKDGRTFSRLGQLAGTERLEERQIPNEQKGTPSSRYAKTGASPSPPAGPRSGAVSVDIGDDKPRSTASHKEDRDRRKQMAEQAKANVEHIRKFGVCSIPVRLALLFGDCKTVTSRLTEAIPGVEDVFLGVTVNMPLLSPQQKEELNPMIIQIKNATSLPATPLNFSDLRLRCHPVFCKYKFFKEQDHVTPGKEHDRDLYWDDTNVVLLGTMDKSELREYLNGPPMEIEVHDRDRKPEEVVLKPTLFGDDLEDEKIANVGTVESRRTIHNPFSGRDKPWDPYGVAKVDMSELLLGHRYLEMTIPIQNCPLPDTLGLNTQTQGKIVGVAGAVDGPVERPLSAGHYIQDTAMLKVKIELAEPLITPKKLAVKEPIPTTRECPFSRIVFIFDYHNLEMLHQLQSLIMTTNANALGLEAMPQHVIDAALSTYKLSVVQQCSLDLDIVTGFHILDGEKHIFVLEGLRDKAVASLWEALPQPENSDVHVLFNSNLSFGKRLYGPLDVDLCRVKLHEPLSLIVKQSLLYVRDMVVRPCFDALTKLDQLTKMEKMTDVVRSELFPTAEMIVSMSREFGVPFTQKDFEDLQPKTIEEKCESTISAPKPLQAETSRQWTPIDMFNTGYIEKLRKGQNQPNYLQANIKDVKAKSALSHAERERNKKPTMQIDIDHNYRSQSLNGMDLAGRKLRQMLYENDPDARYAYNQEFMSAMVDPVDLKEEAKLSEMINKSKWRTPEGWDYPGMLSTKESNVHPRHPDPARLDELKEDWIENILHNNIFKSPLDRGSFPLEHRTQDFDLNLQRPEPCFGNKETLSLHLSGIKLQEEKMAAKTKEKMDWKSRIVVDDTRQYFHRVLPETEMKQKGFFSSNQLDRLRGMLKDPIHKSALQGKVNVNDIPPLAVVNDPRLDTQARKLGVSLRPAIPESAKGKFVGLKPGLFEHTWAADDNHVPCYDYQHEEFSRLKGHDFNVYHKERHKLAMRHIGQLKAREQNNHLFRRPIPVFSACPYPSPLPAVGQRSISAHPNLSSRCQISNTNMPSSELTQTTEQVLGPVCTSSSGLDISKPQVGVAV